MHAIYKRKILVLHFLALSCITIATFAELIELEHPRNRLLSNSVDELQTVTSVEFLHHSENKLPLNNSSPSRFLEFPNTSRDQSSEGSFLFISLYTLFQYWNNFLAYITHFNRSSLLISYLF